MPPQFPTVYNRTREHPENNPFKLLLLLQLLLQLLMINHLTCSSIIEKQEMSTTSKTSCPWQILLLVSHHLDPKALAMASCVCKAWCISISSDHIWQPICSSLYPSLARLHVANPNVPYRQLFALGYKTNKRRLENPLKPNLCLHNLVFAIDINTTKSCIAGIIKPGDDLHVDKNSVFRFDIDVDTENPVAFGELDNVRIGWNIVLKGFESGFSMMDCKGKGRFVLGVEGWFSEELPSPGCCSSTSPSGLVADLRLGLREWRGKVSIEKVSVGVLSVISWRYVCVDDALRYLQHFMLSHES